jgi:hypothetical protein
MNRYNKLKRKALCVFANAGGAWLKPGEAAERLNFWPSRSAWTYFKRLWRFGLLGSELLHMPLNILGEFRGCWSPTTHEPE